MLIGYSVRRDRHHGCGHDAEGAHGLTMGYRETVGDDLDRFVERTVAEHPEFDEMLDAAIRARELIRRLAEARTRAGLTQTEVARRMGTTQPAIARFEAGGLDPRLSTVERYARVVGLRLEPRPAT